mgnify:CR=1 FL=1
MSSNEKAGLRRPRLRRVGRWFALLVIVLLMCEATTRIWLNFFAHPYAYYNYATLRMKAGRSVRGNPFLVPHPLLVKAPRPGYEYGKNRFNSHGFRGAEIEMPKPEGEFRLACLGGSTTMDEEIEDWREAYPAVLEQELRRRGYRVTVINAGVSGYASYEAISNFTLRVAHMDVDMVVLYEGINDWMRRLAWPPDQYTPDLSGNYALIPYLANKRSLLDIVGSSIFLRVALAQVGYHFPDYRVGLDEIFYPRNLFTDYYAQVLLGTYPDEIFEQVSIMEVLNQNPPIYYEHNLQSLIALIRHFEAKVVMATVTWAPYWDIENTPAAEGFVRGLQEMNALTKEIGARSDVPVLDLDAAMPSDNDLWKDPIHNSPAGAAIKAKLYAQFIIEQGLIDERYKTLEPTS